MPRIAIIDQQMSAGGVERFLHGLVRGFLHQTSPDEWQFDLLLWPTNSGKRQVAWPDALRGPHLRLHFFDQLDTHDPLCHLWVQGRLWERLQRGRIRTRLRQRLVSRLISQWVQREGFDLAYFSYPYAIAAPSLTIPMVATPHDFNFKHPFSSINATNRRLVETHMASWMERCARLIVSSEFIASEVRRFYPQAITKTEVVRLGIPDAGQPLSGEQVAAARVRLGLPERFLLTVGWIIPHKNQHKLWEALAVLRQQGIEIPLVSVGPNSQELHPDSPRDPSSYLGQLVAQAKATGLTHGKDFFGLGYVKDDELEALYRSAALLVMPTLYEAGSFPIREALRLGCPVAASRIPVLEEEHRLLDGGFALFDPHDAQDIAQTVARALAEGEAVRQQTARARAQVTAVFDWNQTAAGYLRIFQELISSVAEGSERTSTQPVPH